MAVVPTTVYASLPQFPTHNTCIRCDLHKTVKHVGMPAFRLARSLLPSPTTPAILFIGQNPGYDDDSEGFPFIGMPGHFLHTIYIGLEHPTKGSVGPRFDLHASVYVSNIARCGTWGGYDPTEKQLNLCAPYLLEDIALIHSHHNPAPLFIMLCGSPAVKAFYKAATGKGISLTASLDRTGETLTLPSGTAQIFSVYHPAYLVRKQSIFQEIVDRITILHDALHGITPVPSRPTFVEPRRPVT